ncbi:MAG: trypsin-like peptidase domain-containing protein [Desulfobacterales bacterium]
MKLGIPNIRTENVKFFQGTSAWVTVIIASIMVLVCGVILAPDNHTVSAAETGPEKSAAAPENFTGLAEKAGPAVVNIRTEKTVEGGNEMFRRFFGRQDPEKFKQQSLGSGFIIDKQGHIATNNHVIENADEIQVKLKNGNQYDAEIIGSDPNTDLALIKIDTDDELPVLEFGDSEEMNIGEWILAIGNPFGLDHTVTAGIISAKGRVIGAGPYDDFIQTDASINPGNSGGPILNMDGRVVGISTAIVAGGTGIGFAVPSEMAGDIIEELKDTGEITRGWLGVGIQELNKELQEYYDTDKGVLVTRVFSGDPADEAGIEQNDIIVSVNGKKVESPRELNRIVADIKPGQEADIEFIRKGETKTEKVTIEKRDEQKLAEGGSQSGEPEAEEGGLGITVSDITDEIAGQLDLPDTSGALVAEVESGSRAAEAGFRRGDVIKEMNRDSVKSAEEFRKKVDKAEKGDLLQFYVIRPNQGVAVIKLTK